MRHRRTSLTGGATGVVLGAGLVAALGAGQQGAAQTAQNGWEYKVEWCSHAFDDSRMKQLNELGAHGWEAVNIAYAQYGDGLGNWSVMLKRPIPLAPAPPPAGVR